MAGTKNSGRVTGVWARYTPATTPYANKYTNNKDAKTYKFPSLQQLEKFNEDVVNLQNYYMTGQELLNDEGENLCFESAIEYIYQRKFNKWLAQGKD